MWAICPTSQFCRFFVFFASFRANSFFGVSGGFSGIFGQGLILIFGLVLGVLVWL
jgi:hypothetical protein